MRKILAERRSDDNSTVQSSAGDMDGSSVADTAATVGGYSIIQADDLDAAVALMEGHPHFMSGEGATIRIHETLDLPGM